MKKSLFVHGHLVPDELKRHVSYLLRTVEIILMRVTEPGAGEAVHHEVDEVVRQELVHACLLFRLVSNIS